MHQRLHDLDADPGETDNLAKKHPDVVECLEAELESWNRGHQQQLMEQALVAGSLELLD